MKNEFSKILLHALGLSVVKETENRWMKAYTETNVTNAMRKLTHLYVVLTILCRIGGYR